LIPILPYLCLKQGPLRGAADMPIHQFLEPGEFDPEVTAAMSEAFDAACRELHYAITMTIRQVIAERIIDAARAGERDSVRLLAAALAGIPRE
jgi:hypothetical protein